MTMRIRWSFSDPVDAQDSDDEALAAFEDVRNDIELKLTTWLVAELLL